MLNSNQTRVYEDFSYSTQENNEIIIRRYNGSASEPVIPTMIENHPVTVLGKNSFLATSVEVINIPEGITTIEQNAFAACDNLKEVKLPCSLTTIGRGVFQGSEALEKITVSYESEYFWELEGILYDRIERRVVFCPPALNLEKVIIPSGTLTIADSAFYANSNLKYVSLPQTLRRIEHGAFLFTSSLPFIELPPYLKEIEQNAFLLGTGPFSEKRFEIYAFPETLGYQYAIENKIPVHPLYGIVTD